MIDDPDIFRAARLRIAQHGQDATFRAARRADELLEEGSIDGSAVWQRIRRLSRSCSVTESLASN